MVPPERFTTEKPDTVPVVMVPAPHEPVSPFGFGIVRPAGSVSPKATPVSATVALGLLMVHEAFAASDAPVRLIEPDPAAAVAVPPQLLVKPLGVATTKPAGSVSLK